MCSVVCPVRLDEVNGIEHVVFEVFFGGNNRMWFLTQRQRQTETDRQTDRQTDPDSPQDPGSLFWEASFGKHTWKPLKHGFLDLAKN